jgi:N-acetylglucosaminyldiphosphoundecaprenol N-acetyl-beta-D-mannosaminyltransferase
MTITTPRPAEFLCCDVRIAPLGPDEGAAAVLELAEQRRGAAVHLCNAYTLSLARGSDDYRTMINSAALNLADGFPVAWAGRRAGFDQMTERVYGPTLMLDVMAGGVASGLRHYLYGSTPEVLDALVPALQEKVPGVIIAGQESPPFRDTTAGEHEELADRLDACDAHIVWVGLGTPRQDTFCANAAATLGRPLIAIGAAFDFHAGTKPMAPPFLQEHGLEWAFRLRSEPRRLWRRYLVGNSSFLAGLAQDATKKHLPYRTQ